MKKVLTMLLAAAVVAGCSKEQSESISTENSNVASFSASSIETRTNFAENSWIADTDKIGISTYGFDTEYENIPYAATTTGSTTDFTAVDEEIVYPNVAKSDNKSVIFFAYYPYSESKILSSITNDGFYITHDISGQKDNLAGVDLMTARSGYDMPLHYYYVGCDYETNEFTFSHNLTKVVLTITRNDNCPSLKGLAVTLENAYTVATHGNVAGIINDSDSYRATTGSIPLTVVEADAEEENGESVVKTATVTALIHPIATDSQKLHFTLDAGNVYSVDFNPTITSASTSAGYSYNYTIALGNDVPEFVGSSIGNWTDDTNPDDDKLYPEEVSDDVISFDSNFGLAVYQIYDIDTNNDNSISYAEAAAYTGKLDIANNTDLTSMADLIYFPNITDLMCEGNTSLTKLDLSANTKLTSLSCYGCALTELDITSCPDVGLNNDSYSISYLCVGNQSGSNPLTLYVTQTQYDAGLTQTWIDTVAGDNANVTVVVK